MDGTNYIVPHWRPRDGQRAAWSWTQELALVAASSAATVLAALALIAVLNATGVSAPAVETDCTPWSGCP